MQASIQMALDSCPNVVLVGDINIDCTTISNTQLRDCLAIFNRSNINGPTRILGNSSTLTDPIFVSESCCVLESGTILMSNQISDHKAAYVSLKIHTILLHSYLREVWNYQNGDYARLNNSKDTIRFGVYNNDNISIDSACEKFTDIFLSFCKEIPRKKGIKRPNDKPWFNSELRRNIPLQDRLRKKALRTNLERDTYLYKKTTQSCK